MIRVYVYGVREDAISCLHMCRHFNVLNWYGYAVPQVISKLSKSLSTGNTTEENVEDVVGVNIVPSVIGLQCVIRILLFGIGEMGFKARRRFAIHQKGISRIRRKYTGWTSKKRTRPLLWRVYFSPRTITPITNWQSPTRNDMLYLAFNNCAICVLGWSDLRRLPVVAT